jgi:hypothetical protein
MAASRYDFDIEQGSSFKFSLIYKDSNKKVIDLTNWCARLTWTTNNNTNKVFSSQNLDTSIYNFFIDGPAGKITLMIPSSTTNSFNFKNAKYDLELQSPDSLYDGGGKYTIRILFGVINIISRFSNFDKKISC